MSADESLRRRLYRPGADEEDVAAYLAAVEPRAAPETDPTPAVEVRPRGPRRVALLASGALLVVAAAAVLVHLGAAPTGPAATPLPTAPAGDAIAARLVAALGAGEDADRAPVSAAGARVVEARGTGSGTVALPVSSSDRSGGLVVLLVLDRDAVAGWATARFVIHDDRTIHLRVGTSRVGAVQAGVPVRARVRWAAGRRPQRLLVRAPEHDRWAFSVVLDP